MFLRAKAGAGAQQSYATYILIMTTAERLCVHQTSALRMCCETRVSGPGPSQLEAVPNEASRRGDPYRAKARRRAERHSCKTQSKTSYSAVESTRPKAPIPATVGQDCFTVRHTQRLGLSVRKNAHTPTSQWESRQTAAVGASTRAPHRARRRSHRHDLISGARRRPRHRRDLLSDAAAPRQATLI